MLTMVFPVPELDVCSHIEGFSLPRPVVLVKCETEEESAEILAVCQAAGLMVIATEAGMLFHLPQSLHARLYYRVVEGRWPDAH